MSEPALLIGLAGIGTAAMAMLAAAGLRAWDQWLELRRLALGRGPVPGRRQRGELIELRARIRRLEAIADGAEGR